MRISKLLCTCMCWSLGVAAVWGQASNSRPNSQDKPGILGHYDPQTRVFRPLRQPADSAAEPASVVTFTGTVDVTFTITLKTALKSPGCVVLVSVEDASSTRSFSEVGLVAATGTGSTRTCKVSIPYSWALATQSTDVMRTGYEVIELPLLTSPVPNRLSFLNPLDSRAVPANGATTSLTANVTQ